MHSMALHSFKGFFSDFIVVIISMILYQDTTSMFMEGKRKRHKGLYYLNLFNIQIEKREASKKVVSKKIESG